MKESSMALRVVFSIGVFFILLIPLIMIQSLIEERQNYRQDAVNEINKSWAERQVVGGPMLVFEDNETVEYSGGKKETRTNHYFYLPEYLKSDVIITPEKRYRGIYEVVLYKSEIKLTGHYDFTKLTDPQFEKLISSAASGRMVFNISDLRGIQDDVRLKINNTDIEVSPGVNTTEIFQKGFAAAFKLDPKQRIYRFEMSLKLKGSETIEFLPLGKSSAINVKSSWSNPSFFGNFLPSTQNITSSGFNAEWNVNHFNRSYPQQWKNAHYDLFSSSFGIRLLMPVDEYQKSMRTSKYGSLIVLLTFLSFFIIELFSKKHIHPLQYLLVGLALVLFYSVLLALSEYMLFQYSYLLASFVIIALISLYVKAAYSDGRMALLVCALLALFYGFMYIILQLQDYSLLFGNIALLLVLGGIMYLTRKIDWYSALQAKENNH